MLLNKNNGEFPRCSLFYIKSVYRKSDDGSLQPLTNKFGMEKTRSLSQVGVFRIKKLKKSQIIGMNKIKSNPLEKTREERESCFPQTGREELRPRGETL